MKEEEEKLVVVVVVKFEENEFIFITSYDSKSYFQTSIKPLLWATHHQFWFSTNISYYHSLLWVHVRWLLPAVDNHWAMRSLNWPSDISDKVQYWGGGFRNSMIRPWGKLVVLHYTTALLLKVGGCGEGREGEEKSWFMTCSSADELDQCTGEWEHSSWLCAWRWAILLSWTVITSSMIVCACVCVCVCVCVCHCLAAHTECLAQAHPHNFLQLLYLCKSQFSNSPIS